MKQLKAIHTAIDTLEARICAELDRAYRRRDKLAPLAMDGKPSCSAQDRLRENADHVRRLKELYERVDGVRRFCG